MSDAILQRILAALERIETELKRRPTTYTPSPQLTPAWPQPPAVPPAPYWLDGQPHERTPPGRPFDPFNPTVTS